MVPGERCELAAIPALTPAAFRAAVVDAVNGGARISALFGRTLARPGQVGLVAVLAHDFEGVVALAASADVGESYESITADCPQAHWFEREIAEQWGVRPRGHPWLKPIRFHAPGPSGKNLFAAGTAAPAPSVTDFFRMAGEESHEVAVGPVHAGVIEPGHFRFQCHGEIVHHLEISLGYQHRGVERALVAGPPARGWHYAEALAGDTTIGHATAHCRVLEGLAGTAIPPRAEGWRALALELERLANHTGDLGALAGDVGYLPTASYCGRLRGDFLNLTARVCGSRFGRGM
ncbi:MAG: NADH-quinone oxidoreductase subunit C, partial [Planctomycetes bacterium]|nr:NADH-quinone oxidoreductase subunit C [Planctomycetota bacterium]